MTASLDEHLGRAALRDDCCGELARRLRDVPRAPAE
jgi:hypothetical protein